MNTRIKFAITFIALIFFSQTAPGQQKTFFPQPGFSGPDNNQNLTGILEVLVGDPQPGTLQKTQYRFFLRQDSGALLKLSLDPRQMNTHGVERRWAGKQVSVTLSAVEAVLDPANPEHVFRVADISLIATNQNTSRSKVRQSTQAIQSGSKPWVTIFCRFADSPTVPNRGVFYEIMYSNSPGGLDHYWRENSYGLMNIEGSSTSVNWVELPGTLESYMTETTEIGGVTKPSPDLSALFDDCTGAADGSVDFSNEGSEYYGINMMFNLVMGCCAWGGGRSATLDGISKSWATTWLPPWGHENSIIAHEMGHAFGLPHSNNWDDDDYPYDNPWDVMSMSGSSHPVVVPIYVELGTHTNAFHKFDLGWMSGNRLLEVAPETMITTTLNGIAHAGSGNPQMALIQVNDNYFYTVEARKKGGTYEKSLPDNAVIIYEVDRNRGEPAWAVDSDEPPGDVGDNEGTMWKVGETFTNSTGDILVTVNAETADGFELTIEHKGIKISETEKTALIELYNSTNGDNWTDNTNWLVGDPCSNTWFGVECGIGTVHRLKLNNNNLTGEIPASLGSLVKLQSLDLGNNLLGGTIPKEIGNLTRLNGLLLNNNQLNGSVPVEFGQLTKLGQLVLNNNQLSGQIPVEIGNLVDLWWLNLDFNQINGSIPGEIGDLESLNYLYLRANQLSGSIPVELIKLSELRQLVLNGNQLTGSIPTGLGQLLKLSWLDLDNNLLSGPIPVELGNLVDLIYLNLSNNQISGPVPNTLGSLTNLIYLLLYNTLIDGTIPTVIGNLSNLSWLWLDNNQLNGPIPDEIGQLIHLESLDLSSNRLSGAVPATFSKLTNLLDSQGLYLLWNALYNRDPELEAFLDLKSQNDWAFSTQTVAPLKYRVMESTADSVKLAWDPIDYTDDGGGYRVWYATSANGTYTDGGITADKTISSHTVTGLTPGQRYYFMVNTETDSHVRNANRVISEPSNRLSVQPSDASFQMNVGLNDAWYYPVTSGQGFFITVFPDIEYVSLSWFTYETERPPEDVSANLGEPGHRWLLALGSFSGNQAMMEISLTSGGVFDTKTAVTEVIDGTMVLTFTDCENGLVEYDIPSINQTGTVPIQRIVGDNIALCDELAGQAESMQSQSTQKTHPPDTVLSGPPTINAEPAPLIEMNAGLNDAWFFAEKAGQGFFITVFPDIAYVSLSWFTYETERPPAEVTAILGEPGHRWLLALGSYTDNQSVMDVSITSGGIFDTPTPVTEVSDGTITLTFSDCENGTVDYNIPSINQQGSVPIKRVVGDNIALCEALN